MPSQYAVAAFCCPSVAWMKRLRLLRIRFYLPRSQMKFVRETSHEWQLRVFLVENEREEMA